MSVRPTARIITDPGEEFQVSHRYWQGCPTILRTPRGRLYAGWYSGGTGEPDPENYNLLIKSEFCHIMSYQKTISSNLHNSFFILSLSSYPLSASSFDSLI